MSPLRKLFRLRVLHYACLISLTGLAVQASAQAVAAGGSGSGSASTTNGSGPKGIVPLDQGFNASLVTAAQHDSSSGWATLLTPGIAYRFNSVFSLDASVPIYADIQVTENTGTKAKPVYTQVTKHGVPGDSAIAAHASLNGSSLSYTGTVTLGLPTGNTAYGLSAGKVTGDFNNHIEKNLGIFTPDFEIGIGNSNTLVHRRIKKNFASLGALAHFQAGASIDMPLNMSFDAEAYEELPLNSSTIYSITGAGRKNSKNSTTTSAEDNGFTMSLDVPAGSHLTLSGFFDRSVRTSDNIGGLSATFLLRSPRNSGAAQ